VRERNGKVDNEQDTTPIQSALVDLHDAVCREWRADLIEARIDELEYLSRDVETVLAPFLDEKIVTVVRRLRRLLGTAGAMWARNEFDAAADSFIEMSEGCSPSCVA
jgi:hypothetical protein